ncbi:MAG: 3-deoxy-manno-octulosonate cytidylyltransferase [Simkaniaceae bacterium]|nr:3-deoxy-manno-octulosonate cytidylyltransferase [Candidatus Sacchlamyda saccharinae]
MPKVVCVIPARLDATRFPRKLLAPLAGKPLIQWAYEGAKSVSLFDQVVVAVDSKELLDCVDSFGAKAILTSTECASGTDRLVEVRQQLNADIWVNWQADEPFITEQSISTLLRAPEEGEVWTLKKKIISDEEILSPHVVKVVTDEKGRALYFSRSCIPSDQKNVYKHIGLYAYTDKALYTIGKLEPCALEKQESLEQLRFLYHGMQIQVHETSQEIFGIDTKEELAIAERMCYDLSQV